MNAPMYVKSPARRGNAGTGPERSNRSNRDRNEVPMTVSVRDGIARPRLFVVGSDTGPGFEVPPVIDVTALADALNSQLNGTEPTDQVSGFYALMAGAFGAGMEHQASLSAVS